jgi:beta-glucanase (GH16 family)
VLPVGGESAGVDPESVENPGGAAEKAKPKGKGWKTAARAGKAVAELTATATAATATTTGKQPATIATDTAPSLPARLLTIVADCEARGIPVTVTAVAYTPDPDAVESGSERLVCRWPSLATPSGWSAWESEGVVSSRANPTIREARRKVRAARGVGSGGGMGGGAE